MVILIVDRAVSKAIHFLRVVQANTFNISCSYTGSTVLFQGQSFFFQLFFIFFFSLVVCLFVCLFFFRLSPKRVTWVKKSWRRGAEIRKLLQTTANETGRREEGNCGSPEYGFQQQQQQQHVERRGDAVNFSLPPLTTVSNLQTVRREVRGD